MFPVPRTSPWPDPANTKKQMVTPGRWETSLSSELARRRKIITLSPALTDCTVLQTHSSFYKYFTSNPADLFYLAAVTSGVRIIINNLASLMQIYRRDGRDGRERERESISVRVAMCVLGGGMGGGGCVSERLYTDHLPMLDHLSVSSVECRVYSGLYRGLYTTPATQTVSLSPTTHTHRRVLSTTLRYINIFPSQHQSTFVNEEDRKLHFSGKSSSQSS